MSDAPDMERIVIARDPRTGTVCVTSENVVCHMDAILMCATAIHALHGQHDEAARAGEGGDAILAAYRRFDADHPSEGTTRS